MYHFQKSPEGIL